jgi:hypothetical protein
MIAKADIFKHLQYISTAVDSTQVFAETHSLPSMAIFTTLTNCTEETGDKIDTSAVKVLFNSSFVKEFIHAGKLKRRPQPFQIFFHGYGERILKTRNSYPEEMAIVKITSTLP